MRALVQRVSEAAVDIQDKNYHKQIKNGIVILLGIKIGDSISDVNYVADKCCNLRIFDDEQGKMNLSVQDVEGEILIISQFTLYGDTAKGNRPNYTEAAKPDEAVPLYEEFIKRLNENIGTKKVKTGIFGAMMNIKIYNDGPVTVIVNSK